VTRSGTVRLALASLLAVAACGRPAPETAELREAREAMLFTVATQFRENAATFGILEFEPVVWEDRCLEIERLATCPREPTPGYRLRLRRRGGLYEYRAPSASPTDVALAAAPDPEIVDPVLVWRWPAAPGGCRTLLISTDARPAIGWCDGPVAEVEWLGELFSSQEWTHFRGRFQSFDLTRAGRTLSFVGTGSEVATEPWQLAIERWAELRWSEMNAGRSGAAHGRALAFRKPRRDGDTCDVLEVTEYGVAYAGVSACDGGAGQTGRTAWLADSLWAEMSVWIEEWAPVTDEASGLYFFGRGERPPDASALPRLLSWSERALVNVNTSALEAWETGDPTMRTR
jgi:hypothetical protein